MPKPVTLSNGNSLLYLRSASTSALYAKLDFPRHRPAVPPSSGTITGLPSSIRRYIRIRGIFPGGPGPWSDLAAKMVP